MEYNFISLLFLSLCFSCSIQTDNEETYKSTLLQIQAKDKNYEDITSDTIIFAVKDYYSGKKDFPNAALAAFYCGRLLQEQNNLEKATTAYLEAKKYADHINDDNLKGLIQGNLGILYYYQFVTEKAIENGKEAAVLYHKAKNYKNEISSFLLVGNCFLLKNENDSAFYYYNKGLRLADYYKLQTEQVYIRQSIGVVYQRKGNYIKAKDFLHEAFAFSADSIEKARLLMNIANVYNLENQIDSAKFYIEKSLAIQAKEPALLISTYLLLSEMEEKEGRYKEALQYFKIYSDYVKKTVDDNKSKTLLELQEKYDFEIIENQKKQLVIEKQLMFLFAMFFILLISYFAFFLHRKNVQKKARIVEIEQKIETLMEMNNNYSEKEQSTKNILIRHLNILKKVALIKEQINEEDRKKGKPLIEKFNRIVYEQETFNWDLFYQSLNEIRSGFYNRMREQYPQLEDSEFQICCLYCEHFSSDEIAAVMNFSVNTIHKKTSILRRKIGVFSHVNMVDFLTEK